MGNLCSKFPRFCLWRKWGETAVAQRGGWRFSRCEKPIAERSVRRWNHAHQNISAPQGDRCAVRSSRSATRPTAHFGHRHNPTGSLKFLNKSFRCASTYQENQIAIRVRPEVCGQINHWQASSGRIEFQNFRCGNSSPSQSMRSWNWFGSRFFCCS